MSHSGRATQPVTGSDALRSIVDGRIITAQDPDYQQSSHTLTVQGNPAVIVACASPADVSAGLRYAREHDLAVAVRSGGHHLAGFGTNDGGLVLDLRQLDRIRLISERPRAGSTVRIGTGATWGAVAREISPSGLAITSGDTAGVGVGGLLGGGGIGWLVRRDGLAIDAVTAAEVVTADGTLHRVDRDNEPDLFWGLRGAAGNLGVVTSYDLTAVQQPTVLYGTLSFPAAQVRQVLTGWAQFLPESPVELTSTCVLPPAMLADGQAPVMITVCYAGDPASADAVLDRLSSLGTVLDDTVAQVPYAQVLSEESMPPGMVPQVRNGLFDRWSAGLTEALLDAHHRMPPLSVEVRAIGGALGQVDSTATAFAHRSAQFMINTALIGPVPLQEKQRPAFDDLWLRLAPDGIYGNFLSHPTDADTELCFPGPTRSRLARIKAIYDPQNVFSSTVNVPPHTAPIDGDERAGSSALQSSEAIA